MEAVKAQYCCNYYVRFQYVLDKVEFNGVLYAEQVKFVLSDPSYNIRGELHTHNSDHGVFSEEDMTSLVRAFTKVVRLGAHRHIFCTDIQYRDWFDVLSNSTECVD